MRLWVEIPSTPLTPSLPSVSLLVRLWVEMFLSNHSKKVLFVSLLVRLWVEIARVWEYCYERPASASLWGCELKCSKLLFYSANNRQPPCEAVSWNTNIWTTMMQNPSQPPCEAVSWNTPSTYLYTGYDGQPPCEAVSWNVQLRNMALHSAVSLLVRLWVEMHM